jgi:hypothetical protein
MRSGDETSINATFEVVLNRPLSAPYCMVAANSGSIPTVAIMMSARILTKNPYAEGIVRYEVVEVSKDFSLIRLRASVRAGAEFFISAVQPPVSRAREACR